MSVSLGLFFLNPDLHTIVSEVLFLFWLNFHLLTKLLYLLVKPPLLGKNNIFLGYTSIFWQFFFWLNLQISTKKNLLFG
jgi:hypothetical protein